MAVVAKIIGSVIGYAYVAFLMMIFTFPLWWFLAVCLGWY